MMWRYMLLLTVSLPVLGAELEIEMRTAGLEGMTMNLALFDRADGFPLGNPLLKDSVKLGAGTQDVRFSHLAPGVYALAAYVDVNGNGRLDKDWLGRPTEPYGLSMDARGILRPPSFKDAAFPVQEGRNRQSIQLR